MKKTVSVYDFIDEFRGGQYKNNFSYEGLKALFEYFENYEEETGEEIELDVVAIACDWTEYESLEEIKENYSCIETLEDLYNYTSVIEVDNGDIIIMDF
jgi:hypothetical protein